MENVKIRKILAKNDEVAYRDKLHAIANADEILKVANNWIGEEIKHKRTDDIVEFARGNIRYRVGENGYVADVIVDTRLSGAAVLYDIKNIYSKKITEARVTKASKNSLRTPISSVENSVSQSEEKIKSAYPLDDSVAQIQKAAEGGTLVVVNESKVKDMLATIGVQPSEVSNILNLAKSSLSQSDSKSKTTDKKP